MHRTLCLVVVLAVSPPARADESPAKGAAHAVPKVDGMVFVGVNEHGAEEWYRVIDEAIVIRIPGGPFLERPYEAQGTTEDPKPSNVASFFVDKHEVTNAQFVRFLNAVVPNGRTSLSKDGPALLVPPAEKRWAHILRAVNDGKEHPSDGWRVVPGRESHPATMATGHGALQYAKWVRGRIPERREWEKAAGGPKGLIYPWGDAPPDATRANFGGVDAKGTLPVGSRPDGASPYGVMDMAGNAYERVMTIRNNQSLPVMIKGGAWVSPHPLNLRVSDMCVQPMQVADRSVGFRCAMDDPQPDRASMPEDASPVLRLESDFSDAVERAQEERKPIFLSLMYETCGQCDRVRAQLYRDPLFIAYCNEYMVVVFGLQAGDATTRGYKPKDRPLHPDIEQWEHHHLFSRGIAVVEGFQVSPGNFVLHPDRAAPGAGEKALLVSERELPKWGGATDTYLRAFDRARKALAAEDAKASEKK